MAACSKEHGGHRFLWGLGGIAGSRGSEGFTRLTLETWVLRDKLRVSYDA
jgi:hypothetical protein